MKKLLVFTVIFLLTMSLSAQKISTMPIDSTKTTTKIELTSGDYLIKSSNNMVYSIVFSAIAAGFFYIDGTLPSSSKGTAAVPGIICGGIALYHSICFPINLYKAGKQYNANYKK